MSTPPAGAVRVHGHRRDVALACVVGAAVLAGCGGAATRRTQLPAAPEPASSPPLTQPPAGRVIAVEGAPEGVVVGQGGAIALALRNPPALAVFDSAPTATFRRVKLAGAARHLALTADARTVIIPAETADRVVEVSLAKRRVVRSTPVGRQPHDAIEADGAIIASDELAGQVSVFRPGGAPQTLGGFVQPAGIAAAAGRFGVVDVRANVLAVYDLATLRRVATLPAGAGPTHVVADGRGYLDVVDTRGGALLTFRLRPVPALVARLPLGGRPYGIAIDRRRQRIWIALTERNRLLGLQLSGGQPRMIADLPTVRQPNTVAVDEASGNVYVAGATPRGTLEIITRPQARP